MSKEIKTVNWTGSAFILGIPARNLTVEEYKEHKKTIDEYEKASNLEIYSVVYEDGKGDNK